MERKQNKFDPNLVKLIKQIKFNSLGFFFVGFIVPIVGYWFGADGVGVGLLLSVQVLGVMISSPLVGIIADKSELRAVLILIGSAGRTLTYSVIFLSILIRSYWLLLLGLFSLGFAAGFFWSPLRAIISDATNYSLRAEAFGILSQQSGFGTLIGSFIGFGIFLGFNSINIEGLGLFSLEFSGLLFFGLANLYAGIQIYRIAPYIKSRAKSDTMKNFTDNNIALANNSISGIRNNLALGFIFLLAVLMTERLISALVSPFVELLILEKISSDAAIVALLWVPAGIVSVILAPQLGEIADKIKPRLWLPFVSIIGAAATLFLIAITADLPPINDSGSDQSILFLRGLIGIGIAGLFIVDMTAVTSAGLTLGKVISDVSQNHRGSIFGFQGFAANVGALFGPLFGGMLWESIFGHFGPFLLSIIIEFVLAFIFFFILTYFTFDRKLEQKNEVIPTELSGDVMK